MSSGPRISGTIACRIRDLIHETLSAEQRSAYIDYLPEKTRDACLLATTIDWLPVEEFNRLYHAVARVRREPVEEVATRLASEATARTLGSVWRAFLHLTTDKALLARAPLLYAKTFDTGSAKTTFESERRVRVVVSGWPDIPELSSLTLGVGIESVLRAAGRRAAKVSGRATREGFEYLGTW